MALFNKKKKTTEPEAEQKQPTNEEQMLNRQSAPRPTAADYVKNNMQNGAVGVNNGAIDGFKALAQVIGKEQVQKAHQTLLKYKEGKANLEKKIIENEQWYKLRHWECMRKEKNDVQPTSAWLFNCIANKQNRIIFLKV